MSSARLPARERRATNPFPARLPDLGEHERNMNRRCERLTSGYGHIGFDGRPQVPTAADAAGHVVVVAGRPQLGKSVFTHQCLHDFAQAGYLTIDLTDASGGAFGTVAGPRSCAEQVLLRLVNENRLTQHVADRIQHSLARNWDEGHLALGGALGDRRMVVRVPAADPTLHPRAVAREIGLYATAARDTNDSIYLYEYSYWASADWEALRGELGTEVTERCLVREASLFSKGELQTFLDTMLGSASADQPAFRLDLDRLLDALSHRTSTFGPNSLTWLNGLCHRAFDIAVRTGSPVVDGYTFLQASMMESDSP